MEQLRAPEFYPNEVYRLAGAGGNVEKTLQSIDNTLKRIEAILLDFKKENYCPPLDTLRVAFADSISKMKVEER